MTDQPHMKRRRSSAHEFKNANEIRYEEMPFERYAPLFDYKKVDVEQMIDFIKLQHTNDWNQLTEDVRANQ